MKKLQVISTFKEAWAMYMDNWRFYLGAMGTVCVIVGFISMYAGFDLDASFDTEKWFSMEKGGLVALLAAVVGVILQVGFIKISLALVRGEEPVFEDLYANIDVTEILVYFVTAVFATILMMLGFVALIIPGIYLMVSLLFVSFVAVDQNYGPVETLSIARDMMEGNWWNGFGFVLATVLFNICGVLALGVGLLWTLPVTALAYSIAYNNLLSDYSLEDIEEEDAEEDTDEE